ncbi:hypothetical protein ACEPAF_7191 [Sanghuangporus sanghuang]
MSMYGPARKIPEPLRRLYAYLVAASFLARLPWWIITNLTPFQRPRRSWSLSKALIVNIVRWAFDEVGKFNMQYLTHLHSSKHLEKGYGGVWVGGAPPELITGKVKEWAAKANVHPAARIPGYWIHKRRENIAVEQEPDEKEKVVYFLHGGAYVLLSAHPSQAVSNIPKGILKFCPSVKRSFAVEYRLSSVPPDPTSGQFPSALLDAIAGYHYLVNKVGYSPSQIVVVGDSAGGNLAQALVRYLSEYKGTVPNFPGVPGALILLSPWTDMSGSHHHASSSAFTNRKSDYISPSPLPHTIDAPRAFIEPFGLGFVFQTPYISPACKQLTDVRFDGFPRTFIAAGDAEVLIDQIREFARRIKSSLGQDRVVYLEMKDAFHDFLCLKFTEPWKSDTLRAITRFIEEPETKFKL